MSIPRIDQFDYFVKIRGEFEGLEDVVFSVGAQCKICRDLYIVDNAHTIKQLVASHYCSGRVLAK